MFARERHGLSASATTRSAGLQCWRGWRSFRVVVGARRGAVRPSTGMTMRRATATREARLLSTTGEPDELTRGTRRRERVTCVLRCRARFAAFTAHRAADIAKWNLAGRCKTRLWRRLHARESELIRLASTATRFSQHCVAVCLLAITAAHGTASASPAQPWREQHATVTDRVVTDRGATHPQTAAAPHPPPVARAMARPWLKRTARRVMLTPRCATPAVVPDTVASLER